MIDYKTKLKDPLWQKKRLNILKRDEFMCQMCFDSSTTLHVHHKYYNSCNPWDIPDTALVTLCETCHEEEGLAIKDAVTKIKVVVADAGGMSNALDYLAESILASKSDSYQLIDMEWLVLAKHIEDLLKDRIGKGKTWRKIKKTYLDRHL